MHRLQEMVRLHRMGCGARRIARQLRMGRDTIRLYSVALSQAGLLDGAVEALPDGEVLRQAVQARVAAAPAQIVSSVEAFREQVERLWREKGATPTAIHDWLRLHEPAFRGSLSAVKRMCLRLGRERGPRAQDVAIPVETAPGEVAQVDFVHAGERYDPLRGVLRRSWLFVMTLGFSRHMYADLVFDQTAVTWAEEHVKAFEFFGGVPRVIVPDNLKAAVVRAAFGVDDPVLHRNYRELARHHGFQVDPAPPRAPQKKGKVERGGGYVKHNFLATLESRDVDEDRKALRRWLLEVAGRRRHGTTGRAPLDLFEEEEHAALLPLPVRRWEPVTWRKARLHRDSHVQVDGAFYSAPWRFLSQELWVRATPGVIAIYHQDEHLVTHSRARRGQRRTVESHLPEHRRDLRHRSRDYWVDRAALLGGDPRRLAESIFEQDDVLHQLRKVQAVVRHLETFPRERACAAARRALHFRSLDYGSVKNILRKGLDLEPLEEAAPEREWAKGSRFARRPSELPFAIKETDHAHP